MKTPHLQLFARPLLWAWLTFPIYLQADSLIQFALNSSTVAETGGAVHLAVQRQGELNSLVSVDYTTVDGTATHDLNYTAVAGTIAFRAGQTNQTIVVPVLNNAFVEGPRIFQVALGNPSLGAVLGTRTNLSVRILDNDLGVQFQFATYSASEDGGTVVLGIVRADDGILPVTVNFVTSDLTAKSGLDYTGITNVISFAPQERLRLIPLPILNNTEKQPNRNFLVTLSNPTGASLGSQKTATVTIVDNDQGFEFEFGSYTVAEDAGVLRIGISRGSDDTNSFVNVDFATADITATNGLNYIASTNTLSFAPGEKFKLVTVPIRGDGLKQPDKTFRVRLSNPSGGHVLGSRTTATVNILDSDPGVGFELPAYSVLQNAGFISVTVLRGSAVALSPIIINYATSDLTAKAGLNYQAVSGSMVFEQNETVKTITIPIIREALATKRTNFKITLSDPTGGANLGRASTTISIPAANEPTVRTVASPFDTTLTITHPREFNILTWNGGGQLQRADRATGPWQMLTNARSPFAVLSLVPATFYRVTRPRPVNVYIPPSYDGQSPTPLVVFLPGYSASGDYIQFLPLAQARGLLYCCPDGSVDQSGKLFWNATDSCCDFFNEGSDDAGYLRALIEEISMQFAVDRKRVYLIGHSNGAFMTYRMACQSADLIAGIASWAGTTFLDPSRCASSQPVNILHIHGTADDRVPYAGGAIRPATNPGVTPGNMPEFPGALQTVQTWAAYNGARDPVTDPGPTIDSDLDLPGLDTVITRYTNFPPGGAVELWTINGGGHGANLDNGGSVSEFRRRVIEWLLSHPKP